VEHIVSAWNVLRRSGRRFGPYLLLEMLMPGGTLMAIALFAYRQRFAPQISSEPSSPRNRYPSTNPASAAAPMRGQAFSRV